MEVKRKNKKLILRVLGRSGWSSLVLNKSEDGLEILPLGAVVFLYNGKSTRLASKLRSPRASARRLVPQTSFRVAWEEVCEIVECESRYSLRIQRQFCLAYIHRRAAKKRTRLSPFSLIVSWLSRENLRNANWKSFPTILRTFITCYFSDCTAIHPVQS